MSIASAIQAKQQQVADSYTAVSNKGGTLPATQNLTNLATAISSIPSGGGSEKYGATVDTLLGDVNASGVLQTPTEQSDLVFTGVTDVADYGLYSKFAYSKVKSVSFPDLTTISGDYACYNEFHGCRALTSVSFPNLTTINGINVCDSMVSNSALTSVSFPNLTTISGTYVCDAMFNYNTALTSVSLPNLTTINGNYACRTMFSSSALTSVSLPNLTTINGNYACDSMFQSSAAVTSASFPNLTTINGNYACRYMFRYCTALTDVSFPALTTSSFGSYVNQFNGIMSGTGNTTTHTLHFPSNLQSTISGLTGYPLFGGTSGYVVCAFDLPATS